jgi:hypothetical protein
MANYCFQKDDFSNLSKLTKQVQLPVSATAVVGAVQPYHPTNSVPAELNRLV